MNPALVSINSGLSFRRMKKMLSIKPFGENGRPYRSIKVTGVCGLMYNLNLQILGCCRVFRFAGLRQ
jgi:hypothetical protein